MRCAGREPVGQLHNRSYYVGGSIKYMEEKQTKDVLKVHNLDNVIPKLAKESKPLLYLKKKR